MGQSEEEVCLGLSVVNTIKCLVR